MSNTKIKKNDLNFHHSDLIIDSVKSLVEISTLNYVKESSGSYLVLPVNKLEKQKKGFNPSALIASISIIATLIITITLLVSRKILMIKLEKLIKNLKKKPVDASEKKDDIEMYADINDKNELEELKKSKFYNLLKSQDA